MPVPSLKSTPVRPGIERRASPLNLLQFGLGFVLFSPNIFSRKPGELHLPQEFLHVDVVDVTGLPATPLISRHLSAGHFYRYRGRRLFNDFAEPRNRVHLFAETS